MSRTIGVGLTAHLATGRTTLARCLRLDLRDGSTLGITDHDQDISMSLGDSPDDTLYRADIGAIPSSLDLKTGLEADSFEVRGPIGSTVTRAAVLGGRYDRATARLFDVNWASDTDFLRLLKGKVASARVEGGQFVFEVRSLADSFNQTIGRILTPICSHDFGVGQCQAVPQTWRGDIVSVASDLMTLTVSWDSPAPTAADALSGKIDFTGGDSPPSALDGTLPVEVFSLSGATLTLFQPLAEAPTAGDTFTLTQGCPKLRPACKDFGQIVNFGGFPEVPGSDNYLKYPVPGE